MSAVSKGDIVAFRLGAHLSGRLGDEGLLEAASRCAVQDSPPGSASLALHARVRGVTKEQLADAFTKTKSLLQDEAELVAPLRGASTGRVEISR